MFVGGLYFNKNAFIKTGISICLALLGCIGLNWLLAILIFGHISDAAPFGHVSIPIGKDDGTIELPSTVVTVINYGLWYVIPIILWLLSFTRLREKEF